MRIHLLNTAWMSSRHEQPGSLHFPLPEICPPAEHPDCSLAILHHPTHWFSQPRAMRPLRNRLAEIAAIVLVNHLNKMNIKLLPSVMDKSRKRLAK
jgi:hypothetical protein